jgi:hypothetical protein
MQELRIDTDGSTAIPRAIESAYAYSSRALLRLLEERYLLSGQLRSLRRFFLLEHGDFFTQFMDVAEDELKREVSPILIIIRTQNNSIYTKLITCSDLVHICIDIRIIILYTSS